MSVAPEFKEDDRVETKHGKGTVTYCEDGYMDVELDDRTERSFRAPFEGKVWHYVEPPKPMAISEDPIWSVIVRHPLVSVAMPAVEVYHARMTALASIVGGSASKWADLKDYHRVNFLAVFTGCPADIWRNAAIEGELDQLAERWLTK